MKNTKPKEDLPKPTLDGENGDADMKYWPWHSTDLVLTSLDCAFLDKILKV